MTHRLSLSAVLALCVGCTITDPDPRLTRFQGCDELSTYMAEMALDEARWDWSPNIDPSGFGAQEFSISDSAAGASAAASFSETNLQEAGVDEADRAKTDGTWLYSIAANSLVISQVWPVEDAQQLATVSIDGVADGLYLLEDDRVIVLSTVSPWEAGPKPRSGNRGGREEVHTLVTMVDVSDRSAPVVTRETYTSGALEATRRIGDRLFVVTYADIQVSETAGARNFRDAKRAIRKAPVDDWMPRRVDHLLRGPDDWETTDESSCECTDVFGSAAVGGTFVTNVMSLDLSDPMGDFAGEAVVGRADTVYASPSSLYVAYTETPEGPFATFDGSLDTVLHRFVIGEEQHKPRYDTSAKIVGVLPDQFALSEYQGVLRVATTDTQSWSTSVYALEPSDRGMDRLDVLRGLAPGEQLFSSRFVDDIGYLVTYVVDDSGFSIPNIPFGDPLFTIDLSDPTDIRPIGELQLDGWSDYIHPIGDDHLLTVGMDDGEGGWQVSVSLFDVSDLANPVLADRVLPGSASSEAQLEHHAFNWYPTLDMLAIPSMDLDGRSSLDLVEAKPGAGLRQVGKVHQATELLENGCQPIRRSVFLEDVVYTVSTAGLTGARATDPDRVLSAVPFADMQDECDNLWSGW